MMGRPSPLHVLLVLIVLGAHQASAQDVPQGRAYRGLFATTPSNEPPRVELRWSLRGIYDDNVTAEAFGSADPLYQVEGAYGSASTALSYNVSDSRSTFMARGTGTGNYYPDLKELSAVDGGADMSYRRDLGRMRTVRLSIAQGFQYRPYYQINFFGTGVGAPESEARTRDDAITTHESREYHGRVEVVKTLGPQASMAFDFSHRSTWFSDTPQPFAWNQGGGRYSRNLKQYLSLNLGYGVGRAEDGFAGTVPATTHTIDAGLDFSRPLTPTRRTGFEFSSGSSIVDYEGRRHYRMIGDASLLREFGRSWIGRLAYNRGIQFVEGLPGPLYADTVLTRLSGYLGRRVETGVTGSFSNGQIGLGTADRGYATYSATATGRFALARMLSIETQYVYYRYRFDEGARLPAGVPDTLDRQGLRIGLSGWIPLSR